MEREEKVNAGSAVEETVQNKVRIEGLDIEVNEDIFAENDERIPEKEAPSEPDGQPSKDKGQLPEEFVQRYKDKTPEDLLKTLYESQQHIGRLGNKLGDVKEKKRDPLEELEEEKMDTERSISKLKKKLEEDFDSEYDTDDASYKKLQDQIKKKEKKMLELADKHSEAKIEAMVAKATYNSHNKDFLEKQEQDIAEHLGLDKLEGEVWQSISETALSLSRGDKLTKEDVQAATIKTLGADVYNAMITTRAKHQTREEIAKAAGKKMMSFSGSGKSSVRLEDMSQTQIEKLLDQTYQNDYSAFLKLKEKIETM